MSASISFLGGLEEELIHYYQFFILDTSPSFLIRMSFQNNLDNLISFSYSDSVISNTPRQQWGEPDYRR